MKDEDLKDELRKLRIQAKNQVIILLLSLILVFLWFTFFSWTLNTPTFSSEATYHAAEALGIDINSLIPITLFIALVFTFFYIIILKKHSPRFKDKSPKIK
ncbi:MAG: hypothetical protein ACFE85_07105 [Candidatus Hodarchaeota archaeon]